MTRALLPGRWNRDGRATPDAPNMRATTCCTGECNQGRTCPLLPQRTPVVVRMPAPRIQVQVYPTPRMRLVRRFFRDLMRFLTASRFR